MDAAPVDLGEQLAIRLRDDVAQQTRVVVRCARRQVDRRHGVQGYSETGEQAGAEIERGRARVLVGREGREEEESQKQNNSPEAAGRTGA